MKNIETVAQINFPIYTGVRCLMLPYIQGDSSSVPDYLEPYKEIIETLVIEKRDIGYLANQYPFSEAKFLNAGEVCRLGILTPHESLPVQDDCHRQFLRIVSSGVHGRAPYFTENPLLH